jgi:hypothetical protein
VRGSEVSVEYARNEPQQMRFECLTISLPDEKSGLIRTEQAD